MPRVQAEEHWSREPLPQLRLQTVQAVERWDRRAEPSGGWREGKTGRSEGRQGKAREDEAGGLWYQKIISSSAS
ncbi:hypothetical protein E2C01_045403 [Portunus trituberculatus]|uniref:Uncharacterized protein n=1 Tax=Portunus trituberculatus TaxID=210409 RepID=A0A5B7G259_PORTR|nr:hypothetical protein [Portunus trituberculatus]